MIEMYYDLTVAGAGPAGLCAAIAAARHGLRVALINDRPVPGGNASSEINVAMVGASHHGYNPAIYAKEGGLVEEVRQRFREYGEGGGYGSYGTDTALADSVFFGLIYDEKNIDLYLNTAITGAQTEGGIITGAVAFQQKSEKQFLFHSPLFVDSTGDGVLAFHAGCSYRFGSEGKNEYEEFFAPEQETKYTMGHTILFQTRKEPGPVRFKAPAFAYDVKTLAFYSGWDNPNNFRHFNLNGSDWVYEFGGQLNTLLDTEDIVLELRKLTFGIWDHIKNSGQFPEAENYALTRIFCMPGTRESRRIIGLHTLTETEIEQKLRFSDSVAVGGWPMDVHADLGIYDSAPASHFIPVTGLYSIPLRSLLSRDMKNLFLAGRDAGMTHIAMGSTRVMATCACMGQAVGTAAVICSRHGKLPSEIVSSHMDELRSLLIEDDQTIRGVSDSLYPQLEEQFSVSATSSFVFENRVSDSTLPLIRDYGLSFPVVTKLLDSVDIYLKASADTCLQVVVLEGDEPDAYLPVRQVCQLSLPLKGGYVGPVTVKIAREPGPDRKIHLVFRENSVVALLTSTTRCDGAITRRYHTPERNGVNHDSCVLPPETGFTGCDHIYELKNNICFSDMKPTQPIFAPENVLNGHSRPWGGMNLWRSADSSPQVLQLTAACPVDIGQIQLIWDTHLENETLTYPQPDLTRDFTVELDSGSGYENILSASDNLYRLVRLTGSWSNVQKLRINLTKNNGGKHFGLYAVKLFPLVRENDKEG